MRRGNAIGISLIPYREWSVDEPMTRHIQYIAFIVVGMLWMSCTDRFGERHHDRLTRSTDVALRPFAFAFVGRVAAAFAASPALQRRQASALRPQPAAELLT